jgi:tetratricopeptide (TPR) repeat protein
MSTSSQTSGDTNLEKESSIADEQNSTAKQEALSQQDSIERAIVWAETKLGTTAKNSLWFERVGDTYRSFDLLQLSREAYQQAKELPDPHWRVCYGMALLYGKESKLHLAIEAMLTSLSQLRQTKDLGTDDKNDLVRSLQCISEWHVELQQIDEAISGLKEAIEVSGVDYRSHLKLLTLLVNHERSSEATKHLSDMINQPAKDETLNRLEEMILESSGNYDAQYRLETVFQASMHNELFQIVLKAMEKARSFAQQANDTGKEANLLLCRGVALACNTKD